MWQIEYSADTFNTDVAIKIIIINFICYLLNVTSDSR